MISIIITSFKEEKTVGRAIEAFLNQAGIEEEVEIIVIAPDKETLHAAARYDQVKILQDEGKGKPSALNLAISKAKGEILVLTDGDVYVSNNILREFRNALEDERIGGVSARVVSTNPRNKMFGYWAYLSTQGFHRLRLKQSKTGKDIDCSGYCYAVRKKLLIRIPADILADDAYISRLINHKGYRTVYQPLAQVYVKYPVNLRDWIKQKKRTTAKFYQLNKYFKVSKTRSLGGEVMSGIKTLTKIRSFKEVLWFKFLIIMRAYIWFRVFFDYRLWKRDFKKAWQRVESTK
ncbi:MAG: glycosyltransferase [Nanoarchaeota archaeon]|nr:glycosyltransferase [Nanoarchaeota archaeon]